MPPKVYHYKANVKLLISFQFSNSCFCIKSTFIFVQFELSKKKGIVNKIRFNLLRFSWGVFGVDGKKIPEYFWPIFLSAISTGIWPLWITEFYGSWGPNRSITIQPKSPHCNRNIENYLNFITVGFLEFPIFDENSYNFH